MKICPVSSSALPRIGTRRSSFLPPSASRAQHRDAHRDRVELAAMVGHHDVGALGIEVLPPVHHQRDAKIRRMPLIQTSDGAQ